MPLNCPICSTYKEISNYFVSADIYTGGCGAGQGGMDFQYLYITYGECFLVPDTPASHYPSI